MTPTRQHVWDKTDGRCFYCGLRFADDGESITTGGGLYQSWMEVDHLHPKSKGGLESTENMVPSCQSCNCTKGHKSLEEFRQYLAYRKDGRPLFKSEQVEWLTANGFEFPPIAAHQFWFEVNGFEIDWQRAVRIDDAKREVA